MFCHAPTHTYSEKFPSCSAFPLTRGGSRQNRWSCVHSYSTYTQLTHASYCDSLVAALTASHEARVDNYSRVRERKWLPTVNLIVPAALSLTSATFRSYLPPSIFYSFLFPSAHPYFSLPPPLSPSFSTLSASELTTKACLLAVPPPFLPPFSSLPLCLFPLGLPFSPS